MPTLSLGLGRFRKRLIGFGLAAAALTAAPAAAQRAAVPYRTGWGDVAAIAVLGGLGLAPLAARLPHGAPDCAPCDPASLPAIDRGVVGVSSASAGTASDVLLIGVMGGAAVASIASAPGAQRTGNAVVLGETIAAAYAASGWLKVAVGRERPVMYTSDAAAAAGDSDNQRSFPSGHTTAAFAAATAYFVISGRQHLPHRTRNAVLLFGGATAVGALRVAAGSHFPTDVLAGAAVGAVLGWLIPTLHH